MYARLRVLSAFISFTLHRRLRYESGTLTKGMVEQRGGGSAFLHSNAKAACYLSEGVPTAPKPMAEVGGVRKPPTSQRVSLPDNLDVSHHRHATGSNRTPEPAGVRGVLSTPGQVGQVS
jgi:hypothetical protein